MTSRRPGPVFLPLIAAATLLVTLHARPVAGQAPARLHTLAFADTTSVRFEVTAPDGAALSGAPVRVTIDAVADGSVLWSGEVGRLAAGSRGGAGVAARVAGVRPLLWSPQTPHLYRAIVEAATGAHRAADTVRFGFRSVRAENGRILLNGRPVFLRGNAVNPPGRNLPDSLDENPRFARDYIRYLRSIGVNIIRLMAPSQTWFDVADEEGMMVFQGHYGTPRGGTPTSPPTDISASLRWYRAEVLGPQVNHPSVVIYALSNEQAATEIGYLSRGHEEVAAFLQQMYDSLSRWDDTRLYIGNAGYGFGRAGEICDLHRYWGWYYNSFLSFYTLRDPRICWRSSAVQPITLTENTGNYTGPDGRYNLVSASKQPDSQLNWTGHAPEAEQSRRALGYQAWMAGQAIEITRRLRERNPHLAGLSPFTIIFSNWHGISRFSDMGPKPVAEQYARSYQPVLLSWELWTPQVYAGATIRPVAHVVNDAESGQAVRGVLRYTLRDDTGRIHTSGNEPFGEVPYYGAVSRAVPVQVPPTLTTGSYTLQGWLISGDDMLARNETRIFVKARGQPEPAPVLTRRVRVYDDSSGRTTRALRRLGMNVAAVARPDSLNPARDALVVGSAAWDARLTRGAGVLASFAERGGRILVLGQRAADAELGWLPAGVRLQTAALDHPDVFPGGRPFANGMAINPERPDHPAFAGLDRDRLFLWSDYSGWDESKPGFPAVYPVTRGFALTRPEQLSHVAVLANYDHGLQGVALAEFFIGKGSVLLSGFDLVNRVGLDPVADRLLRNLVQYTAGSAPHEVHPLITSPIVWGDYASERGLVTGIHSGLMLNTVPRVPADLRAKYPVTVDDHGFTFAGARGGWNTRPSIQYVPRGRRPFGPYEFSTGGSARLPQGHDAFGQGRVWLAVPAGRTAMLTCVENPVDEPLELTISVNGVAHGHRLPPRETVRIETPLASGSSALALEFRGDRRLVILETDFR